MPEIKDSGKREEFVTGSVRDCPDGKGRYDLLPTRAMKRLAQHFEGGAKKYAERNWEKGQRLGRYLESAIRHAFNYLEGDRSEDHAIACAWNMMCLVETEERIKKGLLPEELDDLSDIPSAQEFKEHLKVSCSYGPGCILPPDVESPKEEYYYLKVGDTIQEGDQVRYDDINGQVLWFNIGDIGRKFGKCLTEEFDDDTRYRRKIKAC